jgi:hypothetical protein
MVWTAPWELQRRLTVSPPELRRRLTELRSYGVTELRSYGDVLRCPRIPTACCGDLDRIPLKLRQVCPVYRQDSICSVALRCLIPDFNGAFFSHEWKEALWAIFEPIFARAPSQIA